MSDKNFQTRRTHLGDLEISFDNGKTWHDAHDRNPAEAGPRRPWRSEPEEAEEEKESPPPASLGDWAEYDRRKAEDLDFEEITARLAELAQTMPEGEAEKLNKDPRAFVEAYDAYKAKRYRSEVEEREAQFPDHIRQMIQEGRERAKETARTEGPGGAAPDAPSPETQRAKRIESLRRAKDDPTLTRTQQVDAETEWTKLIFGLDQQEGKDGKKDW